MRTKEKNTGSPVDKIRPRQIVYPVIIGLSVIGYMFYREFNPATLDNISVTWMTVFWLFVAILLMFGRDLGYIVRLMILSGGILSFRKSLRVVMLWEFTSAITPSAVGGTSVAIVYVCKEGISVGRSSAIVMLTSFLDECYFILMFPIMMWIVGAGDLFDVNVQEGILVRGLMTFALVGYGLKLIYVLLLTYGLFINPRGLKWLLMKIFRWRPLRRWYRAVNNVGTDIIISSYEIRNYGIGFWLKSSAATFLSWTSRYLVANALIMAFFSVSDHVLLFARQLSMWIMMLIMPTPGGSGFAEYLFTTYCSDLIDVPVYVQVSAATLIAFLWRGVTYYPYLIIGTFLFPHWIKRKFGKKKTEVEE